MSEASAGRDLGLYPGADFRVTTGAAAVDSAAIRQALWYFRDETIAVPIAGRPVASFTPGVRVDDDLRAWLAAQQDAPLREYPPLVWTAAPDVIAGAKLDAMRTRLATYSGELAFRLTPKIPLNRSYFDVTSARYLSARRIKVRGTVAAGEIVARTLWPEDFRLDDLPPTHALPPNIPTACALRLRTRRDARGGAQSPYAAETLWQRSGASVELRGRAIIGIMLNGAQGDDDEAHAGHFALVTGRVQDDGAIGDWIVNNFYTPDSESEKGILAGPVPLDNYLADLNAGQAWYRPSYMLVAALSDERAPVLLQAALGRVYNQFWRHQIAYYHPTTNCTSISVDTLRALGWEIPRRGPTNRLVAVLGFPWLLLKERSAAKSDARCRLPLDRADANASRPAFEQIGASLVALVAQPPSAAALPAHSRKCWRPISMR